MHEVKDLEKQAAKRKGTEAFPGLKKPAEEKARAMGARAAGWGRWFP